MARKHKHMRGSILDLIPITLMIFIMAIFGVFGYFILTSFANSPLNETAAAPFIVQGQNTLKVFDQAFLFLTFMIILGTAIAAFFVRTHPVFFIVGLILTVIMVFIGAILTNIFYELVSSPALTSSAEAMSGMTQLILYLPTIILVAALLIFVALYAKGRSEAGQGTL